MRGAVAPAPAGAGAYFRFRKHFRIASLVERGNGLSSGPPRGRAGCRDPRIKSGDPIGKLRRGGPTALIDLLHQVILDAHLLDLVELSFDPVDMIFLVLQNGIHEFP